MEVEFGLKITKTREDVSSSVDFRFSKDPFGPLVLSRETDSRFIIIIHLKGFRKESIEIEINKDGNRITISGRKPVEEMVLIRWMAWKKEVEFRAFKKVFIIPDIVDLDKIKARFDDDDATLTITMPKRVQGITGFKIEEEKEEEERVDYGDLSEVEEREESHEQSETEIGRAEEFGEIMEKKERKSQVSGEEEKGLSRSLDEEDTEDDNLDKIRQIDEQDKILEFAEEETVGQRELADSNTETEDISLRKLPEIEEQENNQESQVESKSDDSGYGAVEEPESDEQLDTSKCGATENKTTHGDDDDDDDDGMRKVQETVQGKGGDDNKKIVKTDIKNEVPKEDVDAQMGEGFTPRFDETHVFAETETIGSDKQEPDEVEKIHEVVEKKEEEENAKVRKQSEDFSLLKLHEETEEQQRSKGNIKQEKIKEFVEEKTLEAEANITNEIPKPVQEIEEPEVDTLQTCEEKEIADTETKEQESYRPKILAEEKTKLSRKVSEEEENAEKKTEFADDDMSRKVQPIEQRDSGAMKGQEEKDKVQEKVSDGSKGTIAVAENDESRKVEEIDEQKSQEEETCRKQFQKLKGGERSGCGEVEDVEKEKKRTEAEKSMRDIARDDQAIEKTDSDANGKYGKEDTIQEQEEETEKADTREKITTEQELVNMNSQLEQDNINDGEKIKELVEAKTKEKEIAEPEIESECGSLRKVQSNKEDELYEPKIHKERDKPRITRTEEPSCQEKKEEEKEKVAENDNSIDVQEKPERHEKQYKIQEVAEAGHNDHKEEQQEETVNGKKELETEEDGSKRVQEIEKHEYDELKRSMVKGRMQETEEKEKTRAIEKEETVGSRRKTTKDGSLGKVRDAEDQELSKPYKREEEEEKNQELTSNYREKLKKQNGDDILRSQEGEIPDLDEFERQRRQRTIAQLVKEETMENSAELSGKTEDDSSSKFHELEEGKSYEEQQETADPIDRHTGGEVHNNHEKEEQKEKVIDKAELKAKEDNFKTVQETEKQEYDEMQRSIIQDKMQETEEKDKTRAIEESEIVGSMTETRDVISLRKVREDEDPELGRNSKSGEEYRIQELAKTEISDHREKIKKKDELERQCKQRKIHQTVEEGKMENISEPDGKLEGDSSGKFHEFQKQKSYQDWRLEESEAIEDLVMEEATDSKNKHTGGEREDEEERYEKVAQTKTKVEDEINKRVGKNKEPESEKQEQCRKLDKLDGVLREPASDREKEENLVDDSSTTKIQETGKEESHVSEIREKLDIVQDFVEEEAGDQKEEKLEDAAAVVANYEKDCSRKLQTIKEQEPQERKKENKIPKTSDPKVKEEDGERVAEKEMKEPEAYVQELEGNSEKCKDDDGEERRGEKRKQGKTFETKSDDHIVRKIRETKVQDKDQEPKDKIEELQRKETNNHEVELVTKDDSLRKGQEILEKESSNVLKRRPVEREKIQELKEVEKRDRVNEDEIKTNDGKSRKVGTSKMLELDESEANEELNKIQKPMEEETNSPEKKEQGHGSTILKGKKKKEKHQEMVEIETTDPRKEEKEEEEEDVVGKAETIDEYESSRRIHELGERKPDKLERNEEEELRGKLAEEEISNDKEGNRAEVETKIRDDGFEEQKQKDKKKSFLEKDTSGTANKNKNQETKSRDDSSRKTQGNEKQESHEQKRNDEAQDKKNMGPNYFRDEEDGKEIADAEGTRNLKEIGKRETTKMVERHENRDNIKELVDEKMKNQEGENKKSMITEVLAKSEGHEAKGPGGLRKEDESRELVQQRLTDTHKDEETAKTETKGKDNESRKTHQIKEQETSEKVRLQEQGRMKELAEDRKRYCRENEKRDEIQEPVDSETSEDDDEEEIEIEFEESEEEWEAEIIQEIDSDKIRQLRRIKLGFRIIGGSALFMSLIVIFIRFVRSKRKIRCF